MFLESMHRILDVAGLLLDQIDLHSRRQLLIQLGDPLDDFVDYSDGVRTNLAADVDDNGRLAFEVSK